MRDFVLSRPQQMVVGALLLGIILAGGILILKRIKEERQFIKVVFTKTPNSSSPITTPYSLLPTPYPPTTSTKPSPKPSLKKPLVVNINKADKDELIKLSGIGPKLADRILEYRKENGSFTKKEDIMKVKGISLKKFEKCKDMIRID